MGDHLEDELNRECAIAAERFMEKAAEDRARGTWICQDGRRVHVLDMADSHLRNAYRMVARRLTEMAGRADMLWDSEFECSALSVDALEMQAREWLDRFEQEAMRRGITL